MESDDSRNGLPAAFTRLTDPRLPHGVRHPFAGRLGLTALDMSCRQPQSALIAR